MIAYRTKPELYLPSPDEASSCFWAPFKLVAWAFALFIVIHVLNGVATRTEQNLCVGIAILVVYLLYRENAEGKRVMAEWRADCKDDWLSIVSRHYSPGGAVEDGYGEIHSYSPDCYFELEMNADQKTAALNGTTLVKVNVSESIYSILKDRKTVHIYYKPMRPLSFFLAEEL